MLMICSHTAKWFQVLLFNTSNSIYQVFPSTSNNLYTAVWFQRTNNNNPKTKIEQFYLTHLFAHS